MKQTYRLYLKQIDVSRRREISMVIVAQCVLDFNINFSLFCYRTYD